MLVATTVFALFSGVLGIIELDTRCELDVYLVGAPLINRETENKRRNFHLHIYAARPEKIIASPYGNELLLY